MSNEIVLYWDEDGNIKEYDDTWDITIHCESQKENEKVVKKLERLSWIPCSERLPNTRGVYIVSRWVGDEIEARVLTDACLFDGQDVWYDDTRMEYVTDRVVAWMSLPEPYKEEE